MCFFLKKIDILFLYIYGSCDYILIDKKKKNETNYKQRLN